MISLSAYKENAVLKSKIEMSGKWLVKYVFFKDTLPFCKLLSLSYYHSSQRTLLHPPLLYIVYYTKTVKIVETFSFPLFDLSLIMK